MELNLALDEHSPTENLNTWARQSLDGYRVSHAVVDVLRAAGINRIYGQSCPTALFLAAKQAGLEQYGYRTENAGAAIADGAARVSGRLSVITAQNGPAAALLVPGLLEALKASVPILAIVQEVSLSTADRNAFQEVDHEKLFSSCAKRVRRIHLADRAGEYVRKAIHAATTGRPGPVVLLVSPDVLVAPATPEPDNQVFEPEFGRFPLDRFTPAADKLNQLVDLLAKAERPLV